MTGTASPSQCGPRTAIVDIGSNSIRLVVYGGPPRVPSILFNEKVLAGLGRSLAETNRIDDAAMEAARGALQRFAWLTREMGIEKVRTVATAAARDASNGDALLAIATQAGLEVELLSGDAEARAAGFGVLSATPDAQAIVGDLGGGSLELVRVGDGGVGERISFPLGVLRIDAIRRDGRGALDRHVERLFASAGWKGGGAGLPFHLVGGSWRTLARLDMHLTGYPLPIAHGYRIDRRRVAELEAIIASTDRPDLKAVPNLSGGRLPTLGDAAALLRCVMRHLDSDHAVVSTFGLREGLLYEALSADEQAVDPLIAAARDEGERQGRFAEHGDLLHRWLAPLFAEESPAATRLRHVACLLANVGWHANSEFRAERGVEVALHGNWVAIDAQGRAVVAQALYSCMGGGDTPAQLTRLADAKSLERARQWGLAIRLGQRLSGGMAGPLSRTRLGGDVRTVELRIAPGDTALYGDAVQKRHRALATAMGRKPAVATMDQ